MSIIDPRLRYLIQSRETLGPETTERFGLAADEAVGPEPTAEVLVRLRIEDDARDEVLAAVRAAGMNVRSGVEGPYTVLSGDIPLARLEDLKQVGSVRRIEAARSLTPELDLCIPEVRADVPHSSTPAIRGAGVIIGVIDSGVDFRHRDFLNEDGTTRIRLLWDQNAVSVGAAVPYGLEYTRAQINAALAGTAAPSDIPRGDAIGHGTHVCGIAAGCGHAQSTHVGLAPEAELIVVALSTSDAATLGQSVRAFEAFTYVVDKAGDTPVAINFSQGMNGGGHCGETALETGLDNLARRPNVAVIKSAGNEQQMRIHAGGTLAANETRELRIEALGNDLMDDVIEVWFDDLGDISIAIAPPGGALTPFVARGGEGIFNTQAGNSVSIDLDADAEGTGDTVATVILSRGTASMIQPGSWRLLLRAGAVNVGRFDAWIERTQRGPGSGEQTRFAESSTDPTRTISIPGTARNIITVGSYVTRLSQPADAPIGAVSLFSSRGPTRYGQLKPEIVAPGEVTQAARAGSQGITSMRGTSMAAPVVTGAVALILSQRPGLTCSQLKQILVRTASRTGAAAGAPDNICGHGKLDVQAALELAGEARFPIVSNVLVEGVTISWETDIETTGAVRFLANRRQLLLGKNTQSIADLIFSTRHQITLPALPAGDYFCQILAFSNDNFSTEEDDEGRCFKVQVSGAEEHLETPMSIVEAPAPEPAPAIAALIEHATTAGHPTTGKSTPPAPLTTKGSPKNAGAKRHVVKKAMHKQ
jgi:subtilisin family serine protease